MATIWDADILIWAASQIVEAENLGFKTSRFLRFTPYQILTIDRPRNRPARLQLLKGALDPPAIDRRSAPPSARASIGAATSSPGSTNGRNAPTRDGRVEGMEFVVPDWFYRGVIDRSLVLTIDPAYFRLTGGIERWLYRVVRKHAGRQPAGLAVRVRPSPRKVRQPHRASPTSPSAPAHRPAPAAARLPPAHRARRPARAAAHPAGEAIRSTCGRRCGRGRDFARKRYRDIARRTIGTIRHAEPQLTSLARNDNSGP